MAAVPLKAAEVGTTAQEERFIAIAPCRLDDTRFSSSDNLGGSASHVLQVDMAKNRCGRIVPDVAVAYAVRITSHPGVVRAGEAVDRAAGPLVRHPVNTPLHFPVAAADHISVDLEGYYVPPGASVDPKTGPSSGNAVTGDEQASDDVDAAQTARSTRVGVNTNLDGTYGKVVLDGFTGLYGAGVLTEPKSGERGWTIAKGAESGGAGGFSVFNGSLSEILTVRTNGYLTVQNSSFLSGRTAYYNSAEVTGNIVHDVSIVNPKNQPGTTGRVAFFRASSNAETGSPATTKFEATTLGGESGVAVNFDSHFFYHWPADTKYHFRAYSDGTATPGETFWVKAVTRDSVRNLADMYVSGNVGIGLKVAAAELHVEDLAGDADFILSSGDNSGDANFPTLTLMRKDGNDNLVAKYGLRLDAGDANKFKLLYGTGPGEFTSTLLTVDATGNVQIGTTALPANLSVTGNITGAKVLGAVYQDVAEWVPATTDMSPGTVVILNPESTNEVMPSSGEYDVRVAGVVSAQPGVILGVGGDSKEQVATMGRVRVMVDATAAPIRVGDLLVTSSKTGRAMRSEPMDINGRKFHQPGTIIGKALEPLAGGEGQILVLLSMQ
jgi:hypothetical protein